VVYGAGTVGGRPTIGVFGADGQLAYVIFIESDGGEVSAIRDFRYVPYLARELRFVPDAAE
jgi:hypothetical protein